MLMGVAGTTGVNAERLRAFDERIVRGNAPKPGEPHTAPEAADAVEAATGRPLDAKIRATLARIHDLEVADAHASVAAEAS